MNADHRDPSRPLLFRFAKPADQEAAHYRYDHEQSLNLTDDDVAFVASTESAAYLKTVKTEGGEE